MLRPIQVFVQRIGGVDRLEGLGGIFPGIFQDDLRTTGMFFVV